MPPLSALDVIAPAWNHTRFLLLGRRDPRLLLKITTVAVLAELGGGFSFNYSSPGRLTHGLPPALTAIILPVMVALVLTALLVGLLLFYIGSRLQFVLFHVVLRSETLLTPLWKRYGPATWRWIGAKLLVALGTVALIVPLALPAVFFFLRFTSKGPSRLHFSAPIFASLFLLAVVVLVLLLLAVVFFLLLRDFGLPSMALEATPLRETLRRVVALVKSEPGPMALYLVMRLVLGLAAALASYLGLALVALAAAVPLGGLGLGLWAALHGQGGAAHVFLFAGWAVLGVAYAALLVLAGLLLFGYGFTFLQAYATFFLAGRYPLLAAQLQTAPAVWGHAGGWPAAFYAPPQPPPL